jgi:hypothetical protein
MRNRHAESGFSLFESLVVISISFVALTSIFYIGHIVQVKNQSASTERLLTTLVTEATSYKKLKGSYAALNCSSMDPSCYFVQHNLVSPNQKNPFGGDLEIVSQGDDQLVVNFQNIPAQACQALLLAMGGRPQLMQVELFNPDQSLMGSNRPSPNDPPCPEGDKPGDGVKGDPTGGAIGTIIGGSDPKPPLGETCTTGGYSVTSVQNFPVAVNNAATLCGNQPAYTMSWTFGS